MGEKYSGEIINLESNGKEKIDVCVNGNITELSVVDKNLFKVKEDLTGIYTVGTGYMDIKNSGNETIIINGTASGIIMNPTNPIQISEDMEKLKAGTYCISMINELGLSKFPKINLYAYNTYYFDRVKITSTESSEIIFTTEIDYKYYFFEIEFDDGDTFSSYEFKIQLEPGDKATEWQPYRYKKIGESVHGDLELTLYNQNLLNIRDYIVKSEEVTIDDDDYITVDSDNLEYPYLMNNGIQIKTEPFKKHTYKYVVIEIEDINGDGRLFIGSKTEESISSLYLEYDFSQIKRNDILIDRIMMDEPIDEIVHNLDIEVRVNGYQKNYIKFRISILEKIDFAKNDFKYVKSKTKKNPISLKNIELLKDGYLYFKDGKLYHKETKYSKTILTGEEVIYKRDGVFEIENAIINHRKKTDAITHYSNMYDSMHQTTTSSYFAKDLNNLGLYNALGLSSLSNEIRIKDNRFSTTSEFSSWLSSQYEKGNPVTIYYEHIEPVEEEIIDNDLIKELEKINNIILFKDTNNIMIIGQKQPFITIEVIKIVEGYDFYLSENGYLVIPEYNIKYLVNHQESNIPTMPEAVESSVRAAGRDGDIVLKTSYEPIPFNVVCYTEDNLTADEKKENENKIKTFFNSIKNKTKKFAIESDLKFYDVKYNSLLTAINFPSHMKFSIPFKSSESYGKDVISKKIQGNSSEISETVKEVGALITINGPANNPIIALNDYSMEYNMSILDGAKVEIDTNKSTIINVNSDGVKTNVMKYYNHQFPKIQNGNNELKVLSGIDDENQVTVEWNDLKL